MTKLGMHRTIPQIPLKRKTQLKAKKGLNRMSDKTKAELKAWLKIKEARMNKLRDAFRYIPCEYCHQPINSNSELFCAEGHHNDKDRRNNTFENCRILHRYCNQLIEDKNIKYIPSML